MKIQMTIGKTTFYVFTKRFEKIAKITGFCFILYCTYKNDFVTFVWPVHRKLTCILHILLSSLNQVFITTKQFCLQSWTTVLSRLWYCPSRAHTSQISTVSQLHTVDDVRTRYSLGCDWCCCCTGATAL